WGNRGDIPRSAPPPGNFTRGLSLRAGAHHCVPGQPETSRGAERMQKKVRVLIVDDEPALREVIAVRLRHSGYECREAGRVAEAEALLEEFEPDLVLSDVVMPGVSGLELLRRLKAGARRRLPVILMTAHGTIGAAVEAMKEGAED